MAGERGPVITVKPFERTVTVPAEELERAEQFPRLANLTALMFLMWQRELAWRSVWGGR